MNKPKAVFESWTVQHLSTHPEYPNWKTFAVRTGITNVHLATVGGVDRYFEGQEESIANLMAAAPGMLAALKLAASNIRDGYPMEATAVLEKLEAAIAQADPDFLIDVVGTPRDQAKARRIWAAITESEKDPL